MGDKGKKDKDKKAKQKDTKTLSVMKLWYMRDILEILTNFILFIL